MHHPHVQIHRGNQSPRLALLHNQLCALCTHVQKSPGRRPIERVHGGGFEREPAQCVRFQTVVRVLGAVVVVHRVHKDAQVQKAGKDHEVRSMVPEGMQEYVIAHFTMSAANQVPKNGGGTHLALKRVFQRVVKGVFQRGPVDVRRKRHQQVLVVHSKKVERRGPDIPLPHLRHHPSRVLSPRTLEVHLLHLAFADSAPCTACVPVAAAQGRRAAGRVRHHRAAHHGRVERRGSAGARVAGRRGQRVVGGVQGRRLGVLSALLDGGDAPLPKAVGIPPVHRCGVLVRHRLCQLLVPAGRALVDGLVPRRVVGVAPRGVVTATRLTVPGEVVLFAATACSRGSSMDIASTSGHSVGGARGVTSRVRGTQTYALVQGPIAMLNRSGRRARRLPAGIHRMRRRLGHGFGVGAERHHGGVRHARHVRRAG
mmetsp:Transcript_6131/g.11719  ORF Transcript_6131/g.11719 Transcript_6131/m.11719 type:complete len:426 (+) Transcript_6131:968-2245(+)